ncbi:MAG: hypothetical protein ACXQTI_07070 [Candidatus Nezhaarchaeales archaeon]
MPTVTIELPDDTYRRLKEEALSKGLTVDLYIASLIEDFIRKRGFRQVDEASKAAQRVKVPQQRTKKSEAKSRIPDEFYQAFKKWWNLRSEMPFDEFVKQAVEKGYDVKDVYEWSYRLWDKFEERESKVTARISEAVKAAKVIMLSELKPRNPRVLINLARSGGVKVIEGSRDIALVDGEFYDQFIEKLKSLPREPRGLTESEEKLLKFMRENGLVYLDVEGRWRLT